MTTTPDLAPAIAAFFAGRLDDALALCQRVLAVVPEHMDALNLAAAIQCRQGRLDDGIALALQVLAQAPDNAQALETLGDALHMMEQYEGAAEAFRRAAAILPATAVDRVQAKRADALHRLSHQHATQAVALYRQGRLAEAAEAYGRAAALPVVNADILTSMALVLNKLGRSQEAVDALSRAVATTPENGRAWAALGDVQKRLGHDDDAVAAYTTAIRHAPGNGAVHYNLGQIQEKQGKYEEALAAYGQALALLPHQVGINVSISNMLWRLNRFEAAAAAARQALAHNPADATALGALGNALIDLDELGDALDARRQAVAVAPDCVDSHLNLGVTLLAMGREAEALAALEHAVTLDPKQARAQRNLAIARLRTGDFTRGWPGYEWRWHTTGLNWDKTDLHLPRWDGTLPAAGRILVSAEQGVGDEVMFAGLLPRLRDRGVGCVLSCDPRLMPLFARSFPAVETISRRDMTALPADVVAQVPAGSLPGLLGLDRHNAPWLAPAYLRADRPRRDALRAGYGDGPVIGLAWGTASPNARKRRSVSLDLLRPLLDLPGLRWVSLQYGPPDLMAYAAAHGIMVDETVDQMADLDLFAAQVDAMDLVITIDNATVHMASALGKPTWALLHFDADWRWHGGGDSCLWYPNTRLFRQSIPGDWRTVIGPVAAALDQWRRTSFSPSHESPCP